MEMTIKEFEQKYCQDIIQNRKEIRELLADDDFSYDAIVFIHGCPTKVVYDTVGTEILVEDIITLSDLDFVKAYPQPTAKEVRDTYLSNFIILAGEDALFKIRNATKKEVEHLDRIARLADF